MWEDHWSTWFDVVKEPWLSPIVGPKLTPKPPRPGAVKVEFAPTKLRLENGNHCHVINGHSPPSQKGLVPKGRWRLGVVTQCGCSRGRWGMCFRGHGESCSSPPTLWCNIGCHSQWPKSSGLRHFRSVQRLFGDKSAEVVGSGQTLLSHYHFFASSVPIPCHAHGALLAVISWCECSRK